MVINKKNRFDSLKFIRDQRIRIEKEFFSNPKAFKERLKKKGDAWRAERMKKKAA